MRDADDATQVHEAAFDALRFDAMSMRCDADADEQRWSEEGADVRLVRLDGLIPVGHGKRKMLCLVLSCPPCPWQFWI